MNPRGKIPTSERLDVLVQGYLDALQRRYLSPATLRTRGNGVERLIAFLAQHGCRGICDVNASHLLAFQHYLTLTKARGGHRRGQPLHGTTVITWMAGVRGFMRWLAHTGRTLTNLATDLPVLRAPQSVPRILGTDEIERLLDSPDPKTVFGVRARALLELLYASGVRAGELCGLDLVDLDLAGEQVTVRAGKGGQGRTVPIGARAVRALSLYLKQAREMLIIPKGQTFPAAVFVNAFGKRLSPGCATGIVRHHGLAQGLGRISAHTLRHTAAVHLLRGGADIRHIQAFLGHAEVTTSARYTPLVLQDLKEALNRCHPRSRFFKEDR